MRTGRLSISRGHVLIQAARSVEAPPEPKGFVPAGEPSDVQLVDARLTALERLTRLLDQGTLSPEEFLTEKALVLNMGREELLLSEPLVPSEDTMAAAAPEPERGPSLAGRLLGWRFIAVSAAVGVGLSFWAQPQETQALLEQAARLVTG